MALERSRQALEAARQALRDLIAARLEPEKFNELFRICLTRLMAVGPTINSETPNAPRGWWDEFLQPEASQLMKLREAVLKQTEDRLDPNFQPDDPMTTARRLDSHGRSRPIRRPAGARTYSPNWRIKGGEFSGRDPIEVLTEYMRRLDQVVLPEAEQHI